MGEKKFNTINHYWSCIIIDFYSILTAYIHLFADSLTLLQINLYTLTMLKRTHIHKNTKKTECHKNTKASDVCCLLLGKWYNRFRSGSEVWMPTSQKSSLKQPYEFKQKRKRRCFWLMGLVQHHQRNNIHGLCQAGDCVKNSEVHHVQLLIRVIKDGY